MRKEFPAKVKDAAYDRSGGRCESALVPQLASIGCNKELATGDIRYEHINPDGLTGEPTLENCAVLCRACWRIKTIEYDIPAIARAKRVARRHRGIKKRSSFQTNRDGKFKQLMDGTVIPRRPHSTG